MLFYVSYSDAVSGYLRTRLSFEFRRRTVNRSLLKEIMVLFEVLFVYSPSAGSWKRLQSSREKPHWIKLDFDHFEVSDSEEEEEQAGAERGDKNKVKKGQVCSQLHWAGNFFPFCSQCLLHLRNS